MFLFLHCPPSSPHACPERAGALSRCQTQQGTPGPAQSVPALPLPTCPHLTTDQSVTSLGRGCSGFGGGRGGVGASHRYPRGQRITLSTLEGGMTPGPALTRGTRAELGDCAPLVLLQDAGQACRGWAQGKSHRDSGPTHGQQLRRREPLGCGLNCAPPFTH